MSESGSAKILGVHPAGSSTLNTEPTLAPISCCHYTDPPRADSVPLPNDGQVSLDGLVFLFASVVRSAHASHAGRSSRCGLGDSMP